jgi:hypothetical protein
MSLPWLDPLPQRQQHHKLSISQRANRPIPHTLALLLPLSRIKYRKERDLRSLRLCNLLSPALLAQLMALRNHHINIRCHLVQVHRVEGHIQDWD